MSCGTVDDARENVLDWIHALADPEVSIIGKTEIDPGVPLENAKTTYTTFYEFRL